MRAGEDVCLSSPLIPLPHFFKKKSFQGELLEGSGYPSGLNRLKVPGVGFAESWW